MQCNKPRKVLGWGAIFDRARLAPNASIASAATRATMTLSMVEAATAFRRKCDHKSSAGNSHGP